MLKFLGAALIIGGCGACGLLGAMRLRRRARALETILRSLAAVRREICDRYTPMPELLRRLADESEAPAAAFYKNAAARLPRLGEDGFAAIWRDAITATPELMLTPDESAVLRDLSSSLGRYDADEQGSAIAYAERRFEEFSRAAAGLRDRDSRVWSFLGVAVGAVAVILLM